MNENSMTQILMVDDEASILSSFKRGLRRDYRVDTAESGEEGLGKLQGGEYKVIVSDYNMPGMNGGEFLSKSIDIAPDCVRVLLTGYADFESVVRCVNEGLIFRFLTKPCEISNMKQILEACTAQYDLIKAEKVLLEKTLDGAIKILSEILSLANPETFSYSTRLSNFIEVLLQNLDLDDKWLYQMTARLSQLGMIVLDDTLVNCISQGQAMDTQQQQQYTSALQQGANLIKKLPRLEIIAEIIHRQDNTSNIKLTLDKPIKDNDTIAIGVHLLQAAKQFEQLMSNKGKVDNVIDAIKLSKQKWHPDIITAIERLSVFKTREIKSVRVGQLLPTMTIAEDIMTKSDLLLISKGQQVTDTIIARLNPRCHTLSRQTDTSVC